MAVINVIIPRPLPWRHHVLAPKIFLHNSPPFLETPLSLSLSILSCPVLFCSALLCSNYYSFFVFCVPPDQNLSFCPLPSMAWHGMAWDGMGWYGTCMHARPAMPMGPLHTYLRALSLPVSWASLRKSDLSTRLTFCVFIQPPSFHFRAH